MSSTPAGDGRRARWVTHTQERRQRIISAAIAQTEIAGPGEPVHLQEIADRAELNRTVIYRYFDERSDLDQAVRVAVIELLASELRPAVRLDGSIEQIIGRIVGTYIRWAAAHPALHRLVERDLGGVGGSGSTSIETFATQIELLISVGAGAVGVPLDDQESAAIDSLAFSIIGAVVGATRRWISRDESRVPIETFTDRVSESVWFIIDGHARRLGIELDPTVDIGAILAATGASVSSAE